MTYYQEIAERVYTEFSDECWLWPKVRSDGYGESISTGTGNRNTKHPHQVAYELRYGPVSEGLCLDHLCRTRNCWNPDHLEAVTNRVNVLRGNVEASGWRATITHCPQGHPYSKENTYLNKSANNGRGCRQCRTCAYESNKRMREKNATIT